MFPVLNFAAQTGWMNGLKWFRKIAIAEGISYLVLLFIAMPLKYLAGYPEAVLVTGWIHGALFVAYMIALLNVQIKYKWPFKQFFLAGFASIIPFGPFLFEKKFLRARGSAQ